jgi:hypothetical protein
MLDNIKKLEGVREDEERPDAFLMIGQSNMAGRGEFGEVPEIKNPLCLMQRNGRWQPMSEPINPDRAIFNITLHSGVGLAASFADCYAKHFKRPVGLIPCADGGTSIADWQPEGALYENAMNCVRLAKRCSNIKGILWHQGENDCLSMELLRAYPKAFYRMFDRLIADIGVPNIPIIVGELPRGIDAKRKIDGRENIFNEYLPSLISRYSNMALASSEGLTLKADGIHFNSHSLREFGKRYFEKYLELV